MLMLSTITRAISFSCIASWIFLLSLLYSMRGVSSMNIGDSLRSRQTSSRWANSSSDSGSPRDMAWVGMSAAMVSRRCVSCLALWPIEKYRIGIWWALWALTARLSAKEVRPIPANDARIIMSPGIQPSVQSSSSLKPDVMPPVPASVSQRST